MNDYVQIGGFILIIVLACFAIVLPWDEVRYGARGIGWEDVVGEVRTAESAEQALIVNYSYSVREARYAGRGRVDVRSAEHLRRLRLEYAPGEELEIMVNPAAPEESMLESEYLAFETAVFPVTITLGLLAIILAIFAFLAWLRGPSPSLRTQRLWHRLLKTPVLILFVGLFVLLGAVEFSMLKGLTKGVSAQNWQEVEAEIVRSSRDPEHEPRGVETVFFSRMPTYGRETGSLAVVIRLGMRTIRFPSPIRKCSSASIRWARGLRCL